jgi:hypothetical protein
MVLMVHGWDLRVNGYADHGIFIFILAIFRGTTPAAAAGTPVIPATLIPNLDASVGFGAVLDLTWYEWTFFRSRLRYPAASASLRHQCALVSQFHPAVGDGEGRSQRRVWPMRSPCSPKPAARLR